MALAPSAAGHHDHSLCSWRSSTIVALLAPSSVTEHDGHGLLCVCRPVVGEEYVVAVDAVTRYVKTENFAWPQQVCSLCVGGTPVLLVL